MLFEAQKKLQFDKGVDLRREKLGVFLAEAAGRWINPKHTLLGRKVLKVLCYYSFNTDERHILKKKIG